ncbi:MAG TPA: dihydropteroate synthase, partial [Natrialbaceae archaeon]|nr:dihydropteroate synthase [Natrialbaceae archaeon]
STDAALPVSLGATAMAVERGADVIRTHDVAATRDAARIGRAFATPREHSSGPVSVREVPADTRREVARHLERIGANVEDAGDGVARAVELAGLNTPTADRLAATARRAGLSVADGTDALLLLGTESAFDRFVGEPAAVDSIEEIAAVVDRVID